MPIYALVTSNVVQNVIVADEEFVAGISADYSVIVEIAPEVQRPQIGWSYTGGVFLDPSNTLAGAKAKKLTEFNDALQAYLDSRYSLLTRMQFMNLFVMAKFDGLIHREAYLRPMMDWTNSIITYAGTVVTDIKSKATVQDVVSYTWNIPDNTLPDPALSLAAAVLIAD